FTGELRQGALEGVMTDAVAKASGLPAALVRRAVMLDGDLGRVAELALREGEEAVAAVGFRIGRPVLPMLASTADDVAAAMDGLGEASVEWKLDGIRVQVHKRGSDVQAWTRNLNGCTERVPGIVAAVRELEVDEAVLDGEAIWLELDQRPAAFQETMKRIHDVTGFLFDCLHVDGRTLVDEPLRERLACLESFAGHLRIPGVVTSDVQEAQRVLGEALDAGHEGVVVKDVSSTYAAGRRGKAWRKVKPVRTLDLVVIAVEWGSGRRQGWLSNLHLGARDPATGGFVMVGKTFKGLTDELLRWQTAELLARETGREGHVVWVRPELVVEIGLDGVQTSTRYPGGVALRFARVKRYRDDKDPADADTIETVRALRGR
ncbi:MAG TPA: ATP-dependent DNA ligase, partial [Actinomycetota bacterium]|nr:ATP-dependent DNA ligase [Actinomycetota bacterium]